MNDIIRENVVRELGIEELPREMQDEVIAKVGENIMQSVAIAALERLSPEDQAEFERVAGEGNEDAARAFLTSRVSDLNALVATETKKVLSEIKELMGN